MTLANPKFLDLILVTGSKIERYDDTSGSPVAQVSLDHCEYCTPTGITWIFAYVTSINELTITSCLGIEEVNSNTIALTVSHDDVSYGSLYLLEKESLDIKFRYPLPQCVHPTHVGQLVTSLLILCKGSSFYLKNSKQRRASLLLVQGSHNVARLPLKSGENSDPLSHELSRAYVLNNRMVLYIDRDGHRLSLATVTTAQIKNVLSHNSTSFGCHGKLNEIVQLEVTSNVYVSCTHTKEPVIIQIEVGLGYLNFISAFGLGGKLFKSPVVDGKQYLAVIDQTNRKTSFLLVMPGRISPLQTVSTDIAIAKTPCVFVSTKNHARFYCVLQGNELHFIGMQQLEKGNTELHPCGVKLLDGVDTVTSTEDGKILIQGGKRGSQITIIDPDNDTIVHHLVVPQKSKILQTTVSFATKSETPFPMIKQQTKPIRSTATSYSKASTSNVTEVSTTGKVSAAMAQCRQTVLDTKGQEGQGQNSAVVMDSNPVVTIGGLPVYSFVTFIPMWYVWCG